ncbi:MAG: serine protease [Acidimicrobiia bacterium]
MITANIFRRVVRLEFGKGGVASGFTVESERGNQYLVTARHVVREAEGSDLTASIEGRQSAIRLDPLPGIPENVDVAVLPLEEKLTADLEIDVSSQGLIWSQEVFFLGYPHGLQTAIDHAPEQAFAFVKKGIVSALQSKGDVRVWFVDGHNNPGFSGGPMCFQNNKSKRWGVFGVVSGYWPEPLRRLSDISSEQLDEAIGQLVANSGIVIGYDISYAADAIRDHEARKD